METNIAFTHRAAGVLWIELQKPHRLNALDGNMLTALCDRLADLQRTSVKVVVITGQGRAFSTGTDLKWVQSEVLADVAAHMRYQDQMQSAFRALSDSPAVTIAAVNGLALAGGFELALACDIILTAETAQLGDEHITKNFLPSGGGSQRLPRKIGLARGLYHLLTGARMTGAEAVEIGLSAKCFPAEALEDGAMAVAVQIAQRDALALDSMKQLVRKGAEMSLSDALNYERWMQYRYRNQSPSMLAAVKEFSEKS